MRLVILLVLVSSCQSTKQITFNKRYLLDPTMDPTKTSNLSTSFFQSTIQAHDIGASSGAPSASGTCPTCGS